MFVQVDDTFSELFRTTNGVRQGGVMSPKLFSIFVEDLINNVDATGCGIKIGMLRFGAIMYADDLLLLAPRREETSIQLKVIEEYGIKNGMKFNPEKTELVIFNKFGKRKAGASFTDDWKGDLVLDDSIVKEVESFRYLGSYLSYNMKNKFHISKRRSAAFLALNRINEFGFDSVISDCKLKANMFKVYIRTVILYGVENLFLSKGEIKDLKNIESSALKKMLNLKQRCHSTELYRSLNIELTTERIDICKLKFFERIMLNEVTSSLYKELSALKVNNSFPDEIEKLVEPIGQQLHYRGGSFTLHEKAKVMISAIKAVGEREYNTNRTVLVAQKIYAIENKAFIPTLLEYLLHSKHTNKK